MPAAMHLTVLVFFLTVCDGSNVSFVTKQVMNTSAANLYNFTSSSNVTNTPSAPQSERATQITTKVTSVSSQTTGSEKTSPLTTPVPHTSAGKISQGQNITSTSGSPNITTNATNITSTVLPAKQKDGELASNPGLVAILCIFCIVFGLVLVVAMVKSIQSPRSNFERLEDVPLGKVNEESPFAQYSK